MMQSLFGSPTDTHLSIPRILGLAVATSIATGGAVVMVFQMLTSSFQDTFGGMPLLASIVLGAPVGLWPLPIGGALFGWAVARTLGARPGPAMRSGALTMTLTIFAFEPAVHLSQIPVGWIAERWTWAGTGHLFFTTIFAIDVSVVALLTTHRVLRRIGRPDARWIARRVAIAAGTGLVLGSIAMVLTGHWVGRPGVPSMVLTLKVATLVGGLLAGGMLGFVLDRTGEKTTEMESHLAASSQSASAAAEG